MSRTFHFFIHARNNQMVIYEAQYKLDVTMTNHDEVGCIIYGLHCVGGSMAIHGYIYFEVEKELTMVEELLPGFNVRKSTNYENNSLYVFLKYHAICIKTWWTHFDWEMNPHMVLDVEWHHVIPETDQHLWNGE